MADLQGSQQGLYHLRQNEIAQPSNHCIVLVVNHADAVLIMEARRACRNGSGAHVRERAGLNQTELASLVGVTPAAVSHWETGDRQPTGRNALAYGRVLRWLAREGQACPA